MSRRKVEDARDLDAIREALRAAGIPHPIGKGGGTAAWVAVALAELVEHRDRIAAAQAEAEAARTALAAEKRDRGLAIHRVTSRGDRTSCPRPDKDAYDLDDEQEARLAQRRRRAGMDIYLCRCSYHHLGNPPAVEIPEPAPLPDAPILWARSARTVTLYTGAGEVRAVGRVVAYEATPTVQVRTDDGQLLAWRVDMTRPVDDSPNQRTA